MTVTLLELKPSQIKPHKRNVRRDVGNVDELAASIAEQGLIEPLIVVPLEVGDDGQLLPEGKRGYIADDGAAVGPFVLVAGHRRLAAAKQAKAKAVPCIVRQDLAQDPKGQLELMLVENLQRTDLSPVEEAEAYQMLLTFPGYTQKRIAEKTGRAAATIRGRLKLASLPAGALAKVHEGQIPLMHAEALVSVQDDPLFNRLLAAAGKDEFPRILDEVTRKRKAAAAGDRLRRKLEQEGVRIVTDQPAYGSVDVLYGKNEVEEHRTCEGFAAYVRENSWGGTADVMYLCDQPNLHSDQERAAADARTQAEHKAQVEALTAAAASRRAWLRNECMNDASDGLAVDVLRQLVHRKIGDLYSKSDREFVAELLGVDVDDKKAHAAKVDQLDWRQCAILLDLIANASSDAALCQPHNWSPGSYTGKWRTRLVSLYGYTWSPAEADALDAAARPDEDDEDLVDEDEQDEDVEDES